MLWNAQQLTKFSYPAHVYTRTGIWLRVSHHIKIVFLQWAPESMTGGVGWGESPVHCMVCQMPNKVTVSERMTAIVFRQEEMPFHTTLKVRHATNATFPYRCTGRSGPVSWSLRSTELTSLDPLKWGYVGRHCISRENRWITLLARYNLRWCCDSHSRRASSVIKCHLDVCRNKTGAHRISKNVRKFRIFCTYKQVLCFLS
jgi:hypothetical protein